MEAVFLNFIVVIILMGVLTRISNFLLKRKVKRPYFITFFVCLAFVIPLVSLTLGFDAAISMYLIASIVWLLIDHLHFQAVKK